MRTLLAVRQLFLVLLIGALLGGCAITGYTSPPRYHRQVDVAVTSDTLSSFSERPGLDYTVPNSQVYFRYPPGQRGMIMADALMGRDRRASAQELGDRARDVAVRFDETVFASVERYVQSSGGRARASKNKQRNKQDTHLKEINKTPISNDL